MEAPNPPDPPGASEGKSERDPEEQKATPTDPAGVSEGPTVPHQVSLPAQPREVSPQPATGEVTEPDKPFAQAALERAQFFAELLFALFLDSLYLTTVYGWYLIVDWAVGEFEKVGWLEHWSLVVLEYVLIGLPGLTVIWYAIVDFIGAVKRIWDKRAWRKRK